jgi:hypothetical protein
MSPAPGRAEEEEEIQLWAGHKLPGTDHLNAAQGPGFSLWMPSPLTSHHFFMRETVGIYMSHTAVTDRSDAALTAEQR